MKITYALLCLMLLGSGCCGLPYASLKKAQLNDYFTMPSKRTDRVAFEKELALWDGIPHTVTDAPKPGGPPLRKKLNPIWWYENDNEPHPPAWYRPHGFMRRITWHIRNPWSNFTRDVIGFEHSGSTRSGRYPELMANPHGGWNRTIVAHGYFRSVTLSYSGTRWEFFMGYRPGGGSAALEFRHRQHQKPVYAPYSPSSK